MVTNVPYQLATLAAWTIYIENMLNAYADGTITDLYHGTIMFGKHHKFHLHPYHRHSFFYNVLKHF
jgi:hypothetical protein